MHIQSKNIQKENNRKNIHKQTQTAMLKKYTKKAIPNKNRHEHTNRP